MDDYQIQRRTRLDALMPIARLIPKGDITDQDLIGYGGFSDVYSGLWKDDERGETRKIAVKIFRKTKRDNDEESRRRFQRRFDTEINTWLSVQGHPNILEFIGLYEHDDDPNTLLGLVSPFRDEGDLIEYLPKHKLNYRPLMFGIAHGLVHLHANNIIHGDLKPSNILIYIDVYHRVTPQIADFGRAKILDVSGYTGSLHFTNKYTAPEVLNPPRVPNSPVTDISINGNMVLSKASDVWSLGMVLLHVLSGREPYPALNEHQVILALYTGEEPIQEDYPEVTRCPIRTGVWPLLQRCWKLADGPTARCSAKEFADGLRIPLSGHN